MNKSRISIIGIVLVRNEDVYVRQVLNNIIAFVDQLILLDNHSTDRTPAILHDFNAFHSKVTLRVVDDTDLVSRTREFMATPSWVFAIDGDELYDPLGLRHLRTEILSGKYQQWFCLRSNMLYATKIIGTTAEGHLDSPACPSTSNFYNFSLIEPILDRWQDFRQPVTTRGLMWCNALGGQLVHFRDDDYEYKHSAALRADPNHGPSNFFFKDRFSWEKSPFRCVHVCFLRRSSIETNEIGPMSCSSKYRDKPHYRDGPRVVRDISGFLLEPDRAGALSL